MPRWKIPVYEATHCPVSNRSAGVWRFGVAGLGLAAGSAQAGALHWCPGDPPPQAVKPGGGYIAVSPDWDTTVCHDYAIRGGQVMDGNPCSLPQFQ